MSLQRSLIRILDPFVMIYELVISNRRIIFPTIVGLIIALTVISQSAVLIDSYRQEIFEELIFSDQNPYVGDIQFNMGLWRYQDEAQTGSTDIPTLLTNFTNYSRILNETTVLYDYSDTIRESIWYSSQDLTFWTWFYENWERQDIRAYTSYSTSFYNEISSIVQGRMPINPNEAIVIRPEGTPLYEWQTEWEERFENLTLNKSVNVHLPQNLDPFPENVTYVNTNITIVGEISYPRDEEIYYIDFGSSYSNQYPPENSTYGILRKYLNAWPFGNEFSLLMQPTLFRALLDELSTGDNEIYWNGRVSGKIFLDHSEIDSFNIDQESAKLNKFIQGLEVNYFEHNYEASIWSRILDEMRNYQAQIFGLTIILLLVSFPVICIALYLVVYSFGLIRRQKQEQIGILKTRGGSWIQIFTVLFGEMVISTFIAVLIGFTVSIFFSDLIMRSRDYLSFIGSPVPVVASLNLLKSLFIWGIILALILNFGRIWRMSRQKITETIIPVEKRPPLWKRYYLDIVMFSVGTVTWLVLLNLTRTPIDDYGGAYWLIMNIIALLGIPAPFMMFFGSIMVIARFFPYIMKVLSDFLWRVEGGVNAFAIRNVVRHKQAANRAVLLITLALAFSILSSSLIFSLDETERISLYYDAGADFTVSTGSQENKTVQQILEQNLSYISDVSHLYEVSYSTGGYYRKNYRCIFVNPASYAKVATQESFYHLSSSLSRLMDLISDNQTIILFKGNLKVQPESASIGSIIKFTFQNSSHSENIPLKIGGTFKYWPTFYPRDYYDYSQYYWFIGSIGLYKNLNVSYTADHVWSKYLLKTNSTTEVANTFDMIHNQTGIQPYSPAYEFQQYKDSFGRYFSLSILNSDLIVCATIVIVGVIMFAFFTYVERGKEIGVERALGMTRLQTAQSFLVEAITILTFGVIIGSGAGAYFVTMFLQITQFGSSIPPVIVVYPFSLLGQLLLAILIAAGIGTIIPARMASRKDISRILKVE